LKRENSILQAASLLSAGCRALCLALLLICSLPAAAQTDTLEGDPEEEEIITGVKYADSLLVKVPAYMIYKTWDTVNIHCYSVDLTKMNDSVKIKFTYDKKCDFVMPIVGLTTSNFGYRRGRPHLGIDIDLETGDTVRCMFDGRVRIAKKSKTYGNVVVVRHNNGLETIYAHLSKLSVKADDVVSAGTVLGLGGNTGRSTGSHLHFETRYLGNAINPAMIIDFKGQKLISDSMYISKKTFKYIAEYKAAKYYTVKKGDSLSKIAQKNGTSVSKICKLNGIKPTSIIKPGQKLRVR